jgi:hypothetical protein
LLGDLEAGLLERAVAEQKTPDNEGEGSLSRNQGTGEEEQQRPKQTGMALPPASSATLGAAPEPPEPTTKTIVHIQRREEQTSQALLQAQAEDGTAAQALAEARAKAGTANQAVKMAEYEVRAATTDVAIKGEDASMSPSAATQAALLRAHEEQSVKNQTLSDARVRENAVKQEIFQAQERERAASQELTGAQENERTARQDLADAQGAQRAADQAAASQTQERERVAKQALAEAGEKHRATEEEKEADAAKAIAAEEINRVVASPTDADRVGFKDTFIGEAITQFVKDHQANGPADSVVCTSNLINKNAQITGFEPSSDVAEEVCATVLISRLKGSPTPRGRYLIISCLA